MSDSSGFHDKQDPPKAIRVTKKSLYLLALFTLIGFSFFGYFIFTVFQNRSIHEIFNEEVKSYQDQLIQGLIFGASASLVIIWLLYHSVMAAPRTFFTSLIKRLKLNLFDVFFVSLCAGIGEEILFRGAIQEWLGIWLTALVFIALHGYISLSDWRITIYGILMVVVSAGLGYLFVHFGLVAAITAHFLIDLIIFVCLKYVRSGSMAVE
jgi:hypothetical protein